ncbi:MAG TPA: hypothetical protein VG713_08730, partial [Pirellulales bacterium]|nr:hypothetical protein [Pirellulales bacterium]
MVDSVVVRPVRYWPGVLLVGAYWAYMAVSQFVEMPIYARFFVRVAVTLALLVLITAWWLLNLRVPLGERFLAWLALVSATVVAALLAHPSTGVFGILFAAMPVMITAWLAWLLWSQRWSLRWRRGGLVVVLALAMAPYLLTRSEGITGEGSPELAWRWSETAEDKYLAERATQSERADLAPATT